MPGSGLLATITGGSSPTVTYFHDDHLGWRVSTDGTPGSPTYGQVNGQQGTYPFGESWYSSNGSQFVFTTYQRDSQTGLDYAMARYYDSGAARFCSADPVGGEPDDPQTWNRYDYARNDPINLTDPNGQFFGFLIALIEWLGHLLAGIGSTLGAQLGTSAAWQTTVTDSYMGGAWEGETIATTVTVSASASTFSTTGALLAGGGDVAVWHTHPYEGDVIQFFGDRTMAIPFPNYVTTPMGSTFGTFQISPWPGGVGGVYPATPEMLDYPQIAQICQLSGPSFPGISACH